VAKRSDPLQPQIPKRDSKGKLRALGAEADRLLAPLRLDIEPLCSGSKHAGAASAVLPPPLLAIPPCLPNELVASARPSSPGACAEEKENDAGAAGGGGSLRDARESRLGVDWMDAWEDGKSSNMTLVPGMRCLRCGCEIEWRNAKTFAGSSSAAPLSDDELIIRACSLADEMHHDAMQGVSDQLIEHATGKSASSSLVGDGSAVTSIEPESIHGRACADALDLLLQCIRIRLAVLPSSHWLIAKTLDDMGDIFVQSGEWRAALLCFSRAWVSKQVNKVGSGACLDLDQGIAALRCGKLARTLSMVVEAVAWCERALGLLLPLEHACDGDMLKEARALLMMARAEAAASAKPTEALHTLEE